MKNNKKNNSMFKQMDTAHLDKELDTKENLDAVFKEMDKLGLPQIDLSLLGIDLEALKESPSKIEEIKDITSKPTLNAYDLFNFEFNSAPRLVEPFFQKHGIAAFVGTSDTGKSTFLRQLALTIALKKEEFIGFKINADHNKAIYVSTEDGHLGVSHSIKKQVLKLIDDPSEIENIKNLEFVFDTDNLLDRLEKMITENPVDLIVIDAFADVFTEEINSNTKVREFLNKYDNLAKKNKCLIVFLHHTGKRTQNNKPTKDSIIGSQGFEAKMRVVMEIRTNSKNPNLKDLWVLKSNFLENEHKKESYVLNFSKDLIFSNTGERGTATATSKSKYKSNPQLVKVIIELHDKGLSYRKIESELKGTGFEASKTAIGEIISKHKSKK
ncbi:AAA family ATPase [Tenacibaculum maritimum]|uniref:AAA family ATPase n=1 Tax=Tenacibaculum maritimum TaxID=107401 RepID=UPI001330F830|nr:AAA family ATPase [Tenacibaculum maritimum]